MEHVELNCGSSQKSVASRGRPKVSVVMPVYNGRRYLEAAIDSIRCQTFQEFELVVVDDGSNDGTGPLIARVAQQDARIRVLFGHNTGIVSALNDGLAACTGEFIARMDADDFALLDRLAMQVDYLAVHIDCVALGAAVLLTDPEGRPLKTYCPRQLHSEIEAELAGGNGGAMIHPTVMFRRNALLRCGGYCEKYNFIEDLDLFVRLLDFGELSNLAKVLLHYRQHPRSVNHVVESRSRQIVEIIAPLRKKLGLKAIEIPTSYEIPRNARGAGALRRKWALDAAEGKNAVAARANALLAVCKGPWIRSNWACLRYTFGLADKCR